MSTLKECRCGHKFDEHNYFIRSWDGFNFLTRTEKGCIRCACRYYKESTFQPFTETGIKYFEERLREVLKTNYTEFCPNCRRHLGVADVEWNDSFCKIICQSCNETVVSIKGFAPYSMNGVIRILHEFPDIEEIQRIKTPQDKDTTGG